MAVLDDLLGKVSDPVLRDRLAAEIKKATKHKKFGMVFEDHLPECTPLYDIPVKKGTRIAPRNTEIKETFTVISIDNGTARCISNTDRHMQEFPLDDIVAVAEFGEPIFPYLQKIDTVCNAPDSSLWHTLIEADNYHALQLLEYMYAGKVDCIFIDVPYNKKNSKDWRYNCNYIDENDTYRHSKWLSMMDRRLKLAKKLLNPHDSVLIVTIDEIEYLHLGMLLEQLFPEAKIQMISTVINHAGNGRMGDFGRVNEYIYYVRLGKAVIYPHDEKVASSNEAVWDTLRRHNPSSIRPNRPNQFYPIYVSREEGRVVKIGDPIPPDVDRHSVPDMEGCVTVFPVRDNGVEMMWGVVPEECRRRNEGGYISVGAYNPKKPQPYPLRMLSAGTIKEIENGTVKVIGHRSDGSVIAVHPGGKKVLPKNQWDRDTHDARYYGSDLLCKIIGNRFPYPKSLYAVADTLRYVVSGKPDALILDFFAGSGTTLHAVNLLNAEDNGHRRCIMVTNNEIGYKAERKMLKSGFRPGDKEWEDIGIARYATWPRTVCSIEGHNIKGEPLSGNYLGLDRPMAEGFKANAIYFKLGFLDKNAVALGRQFKELLGVLWMKAGAIGPCPQLAKEEDVPEMMILPQNRMAVLVDDTAFAVFRDEMSRHPEIDTIYIVTDSERGYREMAHAIDAGNTYQLYRDYLDNFRVNHRR